MWIKPKLTTTIHVFYYRPDYQSILQEFAWSTLDYPPECPRMRKFLEHWHRNIQARIEQIYLTWEEGNMELILPMPSSISID